MTIPARTLAQLARLSLSDEQAEAVAAMLRDVEDATRAEAGAALEARRAADRLRKQEQRERDKIISGHVMSRDVTGQDVTSADSADNEKAAAAGGGTVFSKSESLPPSPPKGGSVPPKPKFKKPAKPVGLLCPKDLRPGPSHFAKCERAGVPADVADRACRKLIDWSHENAHRDIAYKTDWSKALHRILDEDIDRAAASPQPRGSPGAGGSHGNGLSEMGKQKGTGDVSVYRDPFAHLDRPRARRAGGGNDEGRAGAAGEAQRRDEEEHGRLLDFDRLRAGSY